VLVSALRLYVHERKQFHSVFDYLLVNYKVQFWELILRDYLFHHILLVQEYLFRCACLAQHAQ
jgi:hypothetical protein